MAYVNNDGLTIRFDQEKIKTYGLTGELPESGRYTEHDFIIDLTTVKTPEVTLYGCYLPKGAVVTEIKTTVTDNSNITALRIYSKGIGEYDSITELANLTDFTLGKEVVVKKGDGTASPGLGTIIPFRSVLKFDATPNKTAIGSINVNIRYLMPMPEPKTSEEF